MSKENDLKLAEEYFEEGSELKIKGSYKEAIKSSQKASALYEKWQIWEDWLKANCDIGWVYYLLDSYNEGIIHLQRILDKATLKLGREHHMIGVNLVYLGVCYNFKGDNDKAIEHYKAALSIFKKSLGEEHPNVASCLSNTANCYQTKGDYDHAIAHHLSALAILQKNPTKTVLQCTKIFHNLGICYKCKGEYELAINYYQQSLPIFKKQLKTYQHAEIAKTLNNLGNCYESKGDAELAIKYLQEALEMKKNVGSSQISIAMTLSGLGNVYFLKKAYSRAIHFHQKALIIHRENQAKGSPSIILCLVNLGASYDAIGDYELAIRNYHEAINTLIPSFQSKNTFLNPTLKQYSNELYLLSALNGKAETLFFHSTIQTQSDKYLQAALSTTHLSTNLITNIRQSYKTEGSKHTLAEKAAKTYNLALQIALKTTEVYQSLPEIPQHPEFTNIPYTTQATKELAFDFTEQSKAILLLSSLKDSKAKAAANIPTDLLEKEKQFKIELNYLDKSIATQEAKGDKKDEELLSKFQSQHFDYKQQYDELIEQFEVDYPEYYRLKYAVETASVEEVQGYLTLTNGGFRNPPLVSVVSYHIAEEKIYIFTITSNTYQIHTIEKPSNFSQLITNFQDAIALADIDEYIDSASILFDLLLLPVLEDIQNASKLILIPHNELTTVSFDALIDTRKLNAESRAKISADCDFSALPYLVKDYDISYHYSATMLLHSVARQEQKPPQAASFVGFAPVNFDGSENVELALASNGGQTKVMRSNRAGERALATLPNTENEVKEVFQLFEAKELEAKAFLYASANKQNLFENAMKHKYVLIATHGYAQDRNTGLSGIYLASKGEVSDTFKVSDTYNSYLLHTSEAYHLQLNAELVVLSSCSSGVGKLVTGEGMMAINRGFLYAGASNIIFTHFDIPDESSGELVKKLFSHILESSSQNGSYASALRKAKVALLSNSLKTPEDWAGYALIGG